ncbi:MAG TPA: carboxypeptidase-like regulatory domain-containing protein, partial [Terriglobia bacterium]|nr:carboxypeptidase-like regulatory domain-containing protein [Terriglobia bacterium]
MEAWKKREIGVFLGLLGILLVSLVSESASAQTITGAVTGTVIDTSGAIVPGATVTLKSEATEVTRSG